MNRKLFTLIVTLVIIQSAFAQKEQFNWYFGQQAGLTWSTTRDYTGVRAWSSGSYSATGATVVLNNLPTVLTDSKIRTSEGCFSLSKPDGDLLFYSNGISIWDSAGNEMPNASATAGTQLTGNPSSAQSGVIIPYPGKKDRYIAFTIGNNNTNNLAYGVVDMNEQGGMGDVIEKGYITGGYYGELGESITVVRHPNRVDFWLIAVGRGTQTYLNVWEVTSAGVNHTLHSHREVTGLDTNGAKASAAGYIRFSSNGKKWAYNVYNALPNGTMQHYVFGTFDPENGTFDTQPKLRERTYNNAIVTGGYGVEFTNSGDYLYLTSIQGSGNGTGNGTSMMQVFDVNTLFSAANPNTVAPINTLFVPTSLCNGTNGHFGAIMNGPDGRMYSPVSYSGHFYVITDPEDPANLHNNIYFLNDFLKGRSDGVNVYVNWGLPTFAAAWFEVSLTALEEGEICEGKETTFNLYISEGAGYEDYARTEVYFGDDPTPKTFTAAGNYNIKYTFPKRGNYVIKTITYDNLNAVIAGASHEVQVQVARCQVPVNHNISVMDYE